MKEINLNYLLEQAKKSAQIRSRKKLTLKFAEGDFGNYFEIETSIKQYLSRFSKEDLIALDEEIRKISFENKKDEIMGDACSILRRKINALAYPQPSMYANNNTSAEYGC